MESDEVREAVFVSLASPIEAWRFENFGPDFGNPAIAGDLADPNRNGLVNLLEYALGHDPLSVGAVDGPVGGVEDNYPTLSWSRPEPPPAGISYHPGISEDLEDWQFDPPGTLETITPDGDRSIVQMRLGEPITAAVRRFMVLSIVRED